MKTYFDWLICLLLAASLATCAQPEMSVDASGWSQDVMNADALIPAYQGKHREYLAAEQLHDVRSALELYGKVLLESPADFDRRGYTLSMRVHALVLLRNDRLFRGYDLEASQDFVKASKDAEAALGFRPYYPWLHYKRGIIAASLGKNLEATAYFGQAIQAADRLMERKRTADELTGPADEAADIKQRAAFDLQVIKDALAAHARLAQRDSVGAARMFCLWAQHADHPDYQMQPLLLAFAVSAPEARARLADEMLEILLYAPEAENNRAFFRAVMSLLIASYVHDSNWIPQVRDADDFLRFLQQEMRRRTLTDAKSQVSSSRCRSPPGSTWACIGKTLHSPSKPKTTSRKQLTWNYRYSSGSKSWRVFSSARHTDGCSSNDVEQRHKRDMHCRRAARLGTSEDPAGIGIIEPARVRSRRFFLLSVQPGPWVTLSGPRQVSRAARQGPRRSIACPFRKRSSHAGLPRLGRT